MDSAASQDGSGVSVSKPGEAGLKALADYLAADMQACNQVIVDRMQSSVALIPQLAAHLVAAGGKRLRPLLTLASARLCGYNNQDGRMRHVEIAACVEFIHTATLLHDDVVDDSQLRRGLASANAIFGNKASVLVGTSCSPGRSRSLRLMLRWMSWRFSPLHRLRWRKARLCR